MIRTARNTAVAIVSAAFVVAATSTAATASTTTTKDKSSDVRYYKGFDDQSPKVLGHDQSLDSGVDVRGFTLNQSKSRVSVHFDVVHLRDKGITATVQLQKDKHTKATDWRAFVEIHTEVLPSGTVATGEVTILGEDEPGCTVDVAFTPGRYGTIHARIPRSCLGNPSTLRAQPTLSRYYKPADDTAEESENERTWADVVSWTSWVKAG